MSPPTQKEVHPEPPEDARDLKRPRRYYNATSLPVDLWDGSTLMPDQEVVIEAMDAHARDQIRLGILVEVKEEVKK